MSDTGSHSRPTLEVPRLDTSASYRELAYAALKRAITAIDIYDHREEIRLDERRLSEGLGVSRTPIREAMTLLEQEGFVRTLPRRGIYVVRKTKNEVIELIQAWAALESMAARLITLSASDEAIAELRKIFIAFNETYKPSEHLSEYSQANINFHQSVIRLSGSRTLISLTDDLLLHVRGIRQLTMNRAFRSDQTIHDHRAIIDALERRDTELAERLSREHTLVLARYIAQQRDGVLF